MSLPESIQRVLHISDRQSGHATLTLREGLPAQQDPSLYELLSDDDKKNELWEKWAEFHSEMTYNRFNEFYSKGVFCQRVEADALSEGLFAQLITDRRFLFIEYNEHGNAPSYPSLRKIHFTEAPDTKEWNEVLQHGFVPTKAHLWDYEEWQENLQALKEALHLRRALLKQYRVPTSKATSNMFPPFSIPLRKETASHSDAALKLSQLFLAYLESATKEAYGENYEAYRGSRQDAWASEFDCVLRYINTEATAIPVHRALILFSLMTENTSRLASHSRKVFRFHPPTNKGGRSRPIQKVQATISMRIECNIKLYDYLLKLFPPEDEDRAKFEFYAFSRYDWYTHFRLPDSIDWSCHRQLSFALPPDPGDGVDHLGHLIRRNIWFCIPNHFGWLTPNLPNWPDVDAQVLVTFLLHDATLPTKSRLVNRVERFLNNTPEKKAANLLDRYLDALSNQKAVLSLLNQLCMEQNFVFRDETLLFEQRRPSVRKDFPYSRYIVEHAMKERIYHKARCNLGTIAQTFWGELCLGDAPFDFSGTKSM